MDYAVNPDTGEVVFLVNNKWVPPSDYAVNDKGQKAYLVGNRWEVPDIPTPQTGMGATVTDVGKLVGAGAISATTDVPKGVETAAAGMARQTSFAPQDILEYLADPTKITNKLASLVGLDKQLEEQKTLVPENTRKAQELAVDQALTKGKIQALEKLSQYGKGVSKDIEGTVSPEMRQAMRGATPEGNIIKQLDEALVTGDFSGVSFGKAPSAQGYLGLGAKLLGSSLPALIGGVATKSPTTGGVLGGGAAATEAKDTAKEYISKMSDTELEEKSPYYKNLVAQGVNPTEARQLTIDKSGDVAGMYQGLTAALGSAFTTKLLMGQFNKKVIDSAKDRIYNAISGGVKGVAEESTQELMEGVAADLGINKTVVREIGVDSFANLVLGALGGGGPGVVGGLRGEKTPTAPTTPQAPAQKFTTDEQGNLVPVPPAAPPAPIAPISTTAAQPELFTKEEAPYAVTQDETTAAQRQQAEIERNIDALRQQELAATSTDEKIALTEQIAQLESQLPEAPKDRAAALGEEMMTLERKYKELEATRNATKPLKEKGALTEQMNTIRARQTEIIAEGKQLQKQGVSFAPPEGQAALELEVPPVINDTVAQRFGFTPKAVKIREAIRGLDMTKPEDRQKFRDLIEKHERKGAKVDMAAAEDYVNYFEEAPSGDIRTEPISRTGEPSIQVPSEAGAPPTGTTTPVAGGLGSPVKSTGRVAGGEEVLGEDRTAPLKIPVQKVTPAQLSARATPKEDVALGSITGTKLQQNKEFAKRMGYVSTVGGHFVKGAVNKKALAAAEAGDAKGALDALSKSKSPVYRHIAQIAKTIKGLKIVVDDTKIEKTFSKFKEGVDSAKITIANIDALREAKRRVDAGEKLNDVAKSIIQFPKGLTPDVKFDQTLASTLFSNNALFNKDAFYKYVAEQEAMLEGYEESNRYAAGTPVEVEAIPGLYDPETNTVYLNSYFSKYEDVLAHELTHAISHDFVSNPRAKNTPTYKALDKLYQHVLTEFSNKDAYGLTSLDEFVAEGLSNPLFQKELAQIKYENTTAWNKFVESIAKILGLKPDNAFTELLNLTTTAAEKGQFTKRGGNEKLSVALGNDLNLVDKDTAGYTPKRIKNVLNKYAYGTRNEDINTTKAYVGYVSPEDFLKATTRSAEDLKALETDSRSKPLNVEELAGEIQDIFLTLDEDFNLTGHEGRHRMIALRDAGIKQVPVVFMFYSGKNRFERKDQYIPPQKYLMFGGGGRGQKGFTVKELIPITYDNKQKIINKFSAKESQVAFNIIRTPEGQKAEEQFQQAGGVKKPPKPPAFIRKMQEWKSAYDNNMLVGSMFGKLQNAFSFDRAFSNRMRNTLLDIAKKGDATMEQAKTALLRISISQALYRSDFARKFLATGNYKYDATTNRWEAVQDDVNMDKFEGLAKDLAKRLGVDNETALGYMSKGYEAKRVIGFYDDLADTRAEITRTQKKIDVLKNKKRDKAEQKDFDKKKELLKALEDKANELESKAQHMTRAQAMKGMELYNDHPEIKEGAEIWNTIRKRVIKMLVETGVKSEEQAEKWLDEAAYVPFFRDIGEEKASGPQVMTRGIRETMADKRMKGSMLEVENTVGNMYQWVQWSVARAISNKQLTTMLAQYKAVLPDEVRAGKGPPDSTFSVYEDGVQKFYHVADPAIAQAFTGMESVIFPGIGAAMRFKNAFSHVITRVPIFPVAQLVLMDTWSAMSTSGLKHPFGIVKEIAKEVAKTAMGTSEARQKLTAASVLSTHEYSSLTDADDVAKRLDLSKPNAFRRTMNMLDKWAALNDNMLRQAVFAQAKNEGLSDTEAMEKAVEIVNFRRMSGNAVLVFASKTVPFFNAYSQVLDATGRTLSGKGITPQERKTGLAILAATSAKLGILSFLYAAAVSDDEDYQKKNRLVRDRVFVIPGTGGLSVPLRYDLFLLPKIIGEYSYNLMADKGFVDSKMFKDAMARATKKQFEHPMGGVFAPAIGLATNHDFFFDREIVNASLRKLDPELQYTKSTSELSKVIGNYAKISPAKLDYFFNGYFGSFATLTALATNDLVAQARGVPRPARSVKEIAASLPSMGGFMDKQESVNAVADFYEAAREVNTTVDSYRVKAKADREAAKKYIKEPEHYKQAKVYEAVTGIGNALEGLKRQENAILESKMSSEEKRIELDKINKKKEKLTEPVRRVRKELGY
jgi:hypothetical protein